MESVTVLAEETKLVGQIEGTDVSILGWFTGELRLKGLLRIGPAGRVKATVWADTVEVSGQFEGEIHVARLHLLETARVSGTILAEKLIIREGALLDGAINLPPDETARQPQSATGEVTEPEAPAEAPKPEAADTSAAAADNSDAETPAKSASSEPAKTSNKSSSSVKPIPLEHKTKE